MSDAREQPRLTRRTLLGGLAGAGAAGLIGGRPARAAARDARPAVFTQWVGRVVGRSGEVAAPAPFTLAAVQWEGPGRVRIELRARARGGAWSRWGIASTLGHGPDRAARPTPRNGPDRVAGGLTLGHGPDLADGRASDVRIGEALWTGPAEFVELRSSAPLHGVRLHFVNVAPASQAVAAVAAPPPLAQPELDAGPGQPPIIARAAWAGRGSRPSVVPGYGEVKMAFVHHSDSLNGYSKAAVPSIIEGMYVFHRFVRGWNDIGYNFVIDLFGRIWEARLGGIDQAVAGAQAGGYNYESTGVAIIGTFSGVLPSAAALSALQSLLAWKLSLHGVPTLGQVTVVVDPAAAFYTPFRPGQHVSLPRVAGHRDGCTTDCPGNALYHHLPALRPGIGALAGTPGRITLTVPSRPTVAGAPVQVAGRLTALDGTPIGGAPVEVQRFSVTLAGTSETTLASAVTGPDGSFTAAVPLTRDALLRALHRPAPAAVSTLVGVAVPPAITVTATSTAPLTIAGTVHPPTKTVTVALFAVQASGAWKPLHRARVRVRRGAFAVTLATPGPGEYGVSVHTPADASNAAGVSPPLTVTVPSGPYTLPVSRR